MHGITGKHSLQTSKHAQHIQLMYKIMCGKYKRIGDGIQMDAIVDNGYIFDFYFCRERVDKKWTDARLCQMHACFKTCIIMLIWITFFSSVQFTVAVASYKTQALTQGLLHEKGCGALLCIIKKEVKGKKANAVRGTIKAAIL